MINRTLNTYNIAILAVQETHMDWELLQNIRACFGRKMEILLSPHPETPRTSAGVAFIINKTLIKTRKCTVSELIEGRAITLKIEWLESETTTLINVYAPNNKTEHPTFWEQVDTARQAYGLGHPSFLLGDFNLVKDPIDRSPAHPDDANAVEVLRDLRHQNGLEDIWRRYHPTDRCFTYRANINGRQIQSRINRIYVARRNAELTYEWKIVPTPVPTDHWLTMTKYAPAETPVIGKGQWSLKTHMLNDTKLLDKIDTRGKTLEDRLAEVQRNNPPREENNPQLLWKAFKTETCNLIKKDDLKKHGKCTTLRENIKKDIKNLTTNLEIDINDSLRAEEAFLASELSHLEKLDATKSKKYYRALAMDHGEKLGGICSAQSKVKRPRDYIHRL
ncbi:Endonuclease/exonuclease/phosphatase [Lactarius deliciosus]|nr:Endonuclease/exonuclease/phosphatase [Lactarius deliciosus]